MSKVKEREGILPTFRAVCKEHGTNITNALISCGRSSSLAAGWKVGGFPRLDVAMDIAEYLGVSLDELCYGLDDARTVILTENQREWLQIIKRIPEDRQGVCKDFLKTHAVIPEKYDEAGEKIS